MAGEIVPEAFGECVTRYRTRPAWRAWHLFKYGGASAFFLFFVVIGLFPQVLERGPRPPKPQDLPGIMAIFLVLGGMGLCATVPLLLHAYFTGITQIVVFEQGFIIHRPRKIIPVSWSAVEAVWKIVIDEHGLPKLLHFEIELADGKKLKLLSSDLETLDDFGEFAQKTVSVRLLPVAVDDLATGKELKFGKVRLSKDYLVTPAQTWKWEEVDGLEFDEFVCLSVISQGERFRTRASHNCFPNHPVFFTLAHQLIAEHH